MECQECRYYETWKEGMGFCLRMPPMLSVRDGATRKEKIEVEPDRPACGEFKNIPE